MLQVPSATVTEVLSQIAALGFGCRTPEVVGAASRRLFDPRTSLRDLLLTLTANRMCHRKLRQIFIDILRALGSDILQGLWGFIKFYDSIDPQILLTELSTQGYGYTKLALTMLVHFAPMLLKFGKAVEGPTASRGCGTVAGCGRSGSMARGLTARNHVTLLCGARLRLQ